MTSMCRTVKTRRYSQRKVSFWDSVSAVPLHPQLAKRAREEEMQEFSKHGVYVKVPVRECLEKTGKKPIGVKWVDINKGDEERPEYRSRLVA